MANVGDEADFGSGFLDSMLEVEMTEEDDELDMSKNEDPLGENSRDLPPIPTFDLQSETLSYKDVYSNQTAQPIQQILTQIPIADPALPETISLAVPVLKAPMLTLYSRELPTSKSTRTVAINKATTPAQKNSPKPNTKPVGKTLIKNPEISEKIEAVQFLQQVFKPEYVNSVFVKEDPPSDIGVFGKEEMEYYNNCFKDVSKVRHCKLHCTICNAHLGCSVNVEKKVTVHSMLKVLTCKPCYEFYGDGNFPCDKGDNCEIYCRWCGQGGALVCCSYCPRVFCKKCVRRNFGSEFLKKIQRASDWACFCCAQKPLWPHRAICRALMEYIKLRKTDPKKNQKDLSKCCERTALNSKKVKPPEKDKIIVSQGQVKLGPISTTTKNSVATTTDLGNKLILPLKTGSGKEQSLLKSNIQVKIGDQNKSSASSVTILNKNSKTNAANLFTSRSLITGNNIIRGSPIKSLSSLPSPQMIQAPVLHGETLITPPGSRMLIPTKTPPPTKRSLPNSSYVRVTLTNQTSNLDLSKIPTVKIPHDVQGLVLRMSFPDNKVQLVRLMTDGNGCKGDQSFPMPEFKSPDDLSFVEESLFHSFKMSKMVFDELMMLREKVNSRTKFTEESVYSSSVKKLHSVYEKSIELLKDLDKSLLENFDEWKKHGKASVDVIDLSDEDSKSQAKAKKRKSDFLEKCKELLLSDDSDIEILDDVTDKTESPNSVDKNSLRRPSSEPMKSQQKSKRKRMGKRPGRKPKGSVRNKEEDMPEVVNESVEKINEVEEKEDPLGGCATGMENGLEDSMGKEKSSAEEVDGENNSESETTNEDANISKLTEDAIDAEWMRMEE